MKLHARKILPAIAGLALLPLSLHASVDSTMKVDMKCYVQDKFSETSANKFGTVRTVRVDTKQLLTLLGKQTKSKYPSGAQLKVATNGQVTVVDSRGAFVGNAGPYIKAKLALKSSIFSGKYNAASGKETSKNYYRFTLIVDLPTLKGNVKGTAIEDFKVSGPSGDGVRITSGATNVSVNGQGKVDGKTGYYNGNIYLRGRSASIAP